jgi:hypothetical protein
MCAGGGREPAELDAEDQLGQRCEHHDRQRQDDQGDHQGRVVEQAAPADAGDDAGDQRHGRRDDDGDQRELDGRGPGQLHHVSDLAAGQRGAEVAGEQALHVVPVLHEEGLVEVVALGQDLAHVVGEGSFARQGLEGVILVGEHQRVHDEGGPEEGQDHLQ